MISQFWFHGLRNCFITVAECDLFLPLSLTKRLVMRLTIQMSCRCCLARGWTDFGSHTRPSDIIEGYAADWSIDSCTSPRSVSPTR